MNKITGKTGVLEKIVRRNEELMGKAIKKFGLKRNKVCFDVYKCLSDKLKEDDEKLFNLFQRPSGTTKKGLNTLLNFAFELAQIKPLWVLKYEKALEILLKNPPPNMLKAFGYKDIKELLEKEDLKEVFSALRFIESNEWMHKTFDRAYNNLKLKDFEERRVDLLVLSGKWLDIAEKFVKKKYHNVSHLKELGIIFVIPLKIDTPGETIRLFTLVLHYLHEIAFYNRLFKKYAKGKNFSKRIISLLRGDVIEKSKIKNLPQPLPTILSRKRIISQKSKIMNWLIIQRYLAKEDENDKRLFIPHVNSEAIHWRKAENDISRLSERFGELELELNFWAKLDFVGDYFDGNLVSFDLIDNIISLARDEKTSKYLYHHQEALWNKIFIEYIGEKKMEEIMVDNFEKGYISLNS